MIETLIFFAGQLLINFGIRLWHRDKLSYVFCSFAPLIFPLLMILYPSLSWHIYDLFYPPDPKLEFQCGNSMIGSVLFQWIIGMPFSYLFQRLFNRYLHKFNLLIDKFEPKIEKKN
jgi:hypothetical protein